MESGVIQKVPYYRQLILTLWQEAGHTPTQPSPWRLSLQNPHTQERTGFREPEELVAFLHAWMEAQAQESDQVSNQKPNQ